MTSIDINPVELKAARDLIGAASNKETVDVALKTLIAIRRQPSAVNRIISRSFSDAQIEGEHAPSADAQPPAR